MLTLPVLDETDERVSLMDILRNQQRPLSRHEVSIKHTPISMIE